MNQINDAHEFYLNKDAVGAEMRDQAIKFYNMMAYWNEQLSILEAKRKSLQSVLDQVKDKARATRALKASELSLKASIQDAFIKDIHDTIVNLQGSSLTPAGVQEQLNEVYSSELEARACVNTLTYALDICRSALSWDKQEHQHTSSG